MDYLEDNKIKEFVNDAIIDKLENIKGYNKKHYACDLAYILFDCENQTGAYFCNDYEAKKWVQNHFLELEEILKEISYNYGSETSEKIFLNIFSNPDAFVVAIVLEVANYILSQCKTINIKWNDKIILDNKTIEKLTKEVKEL